VCKIHWERRDYPPPGVDQTGWPGLSHHLSGELGKMTTADYCYLVIDNVDAASQHQAIQLYQDFAGNRALIMFMITKDLELLHEAGHNYPVDLKRFRMQPLTPEQAVIFVKRRIERYRNEDYADLLQGYKLFPFLAENIHRVVAEKDGRLGEGPVTLRVLASALHEMMLTRLIEDGQDFELAALSPDQLHDQLLMLPSAYGELVA
jgi:hypothetical protein